jgi:hypothetical protein
MEYKGLTNQEIIQRFICCGVDGTFFFSSLLHLGDGTIEGDTFSPKQHLKFTKLDGIVET